MGVDVTIFNHTTGEQYFAGRLKFFKEETIYEYCPWWKKTDKIIAEYDDGSFPITKVDIPLKEIYVDGVHYIESPMFVDAGDFWDMKGSIYYVFNRIYKQCARVGDIKYLSETIDLLDWSIKDCFEASMGGIFDITKDRGQGEKIERPTDIETYERFI